ncbi:MAG: ATP-binding protein, partial [Leptospiraceae bacterium]|nr:ATP-binding protein [Leptospiraceae bacterium]
MKYASLLVPGFSSAGQPVRARIESATRTGIPEFRISGIPPARARDMAERIQCAFQMSGLRPGHKNIVVHIEGNLDAYFLEELDLPVAACVLGALGYELHGTEEGSSYLGKLLLSGHIRPLPDLIRYLVAARMLGIESLLANGSEMDTRSLSAYYRLASPGKNGHGENSADPGRSMARGRIVLCLRDLLRFSTAPPPIQPEYSDFLKAKSHGRTDGEKAPDLVVDAVPERDAHSHGQILHSFLSLNSDGDSASLPYSRFVLRAAVAAAGARHSLLCLGPPGCGKTTLAGLIYALLPPMDESELKRIFLSSFYEIEGPGRIARPFRRPHHSATRVALVGGGTPVRAGEVTLANDGLLLLDELGEFRRDVLQALREPMDSG